MVACGYSDLTRELQWAPGLELSITFDPGKQEEPVGASQIRRYPFAPKQKVDPQAALQIRRAVLRERPDILHAFYGRPLSNALLGTTGLKHRPKIVSFRGIATPANKWDPSDWISYLHPRVAAHACESEAVRQGLIASGIEPERCGVTYNCVVPVPFDGSGRDALKPWRIPSDAFVVGTVATARPVKGIDLLMEAAIECADLDDTYWIVIGKIRDKRIERLASDSRIRDRVRLLGYRDDARRLICGADVFVMPSRQEALCRSLLEAMSQGICPVVSDAGGLKEAVRPGIDGVVFPRGDAKELAQAIRRLYADRSLVQRFANSAYRRARDFFSPAKMAERVVDLYRRVLAGSDRN